MASPTYQLIDGRVKVQIEDLLGTKPGGGWVYQGPGTGNNPGAEGAHYYYRSQTQEGSHKTVPQDGRFTFDIDVQQAGTYSILLRASRDTADPGDARNDIWIKVDGDTQSVMPEGTPQLTSGGDGFVKYKSGPPPNKWVDAKMFSTPVHGDKNPVSDVVFDRGIHTITFAPRSTGYHIDSVQIVQRSVLPEPGPQIFTTSALVTSRPNDFETVGGAYDTDLDLGMSGGTANQVGLRFTGLELPANAEIESAYIVFTASGASAAGGSLTIQLQNYLSAVNFVAGAPLNARGYLDETVAWTDLGAWNTGQTYRSADISTLIEALIADGGLDAVNALAFRISGTGAHSANTFESGGRTPELVINYVEAADPAPNAVEKPAPQILTTSARVPTKTSDVETADGLDDADLDLGTSGGVANHVGLRFNGLVLDPAAEIESAYLVFTASAAAAAGGGLTIELQNSRAASNFRTGTPLDDRSYLAEAVAWDDLGAWKAGETYRSADISTLIEALIDDGGLDALDALAFRLSGTGAHSAHSADGRISAAPELVINYFEGA
jgi:hypothetical protein